MYYPVHQKCYLLAGFDDLDIDIKLKGKNDSQTTIYVIVYGVTGIHSDVPIQVWDRLYYFDKDNEQITFKTSIDMNNNIIVGFKEDTEDSCAVNFKQLDFLSNLLK